MLGFTWFVGFCLLPSLALAGMADTLAPSKDHPAIAYSSGAYSSTESNDPVAALNRKLRSGQGGSDKVQLKFEDRAGYLRAVLDALKIPVESQIAVFSKTSLQLALINPSNPRTLFFNDSVVVGWMGGGKIEAAAQDPRQGVKFYTLEQRKVNRPGFEPGNDCLRCHISEASLGVPGMMVRSMFTAPDGSTRLVYGGYFSDHRSPLAERYGGWYVTGDTGAMKHLGNAAITEQDQPETLAGARRLDSLKAKFNTDAYLSPYSDIAALLVFDHQMHMMNLITRIGWEARVGNPLEDVAAELVDYLLFVDEAPLPGPVRGTSGFTEAFAARGPFDKKGRCLRQLDLGKRLPRYPCSYMIYSDAFEALPAEAKAAIYKRMWQVLSGAAQDKKYLKLSLADRRAVVEILRDTKKDLPGYFAVVVR